MSMDLTPCGDPHCPQCKADLPPQATFCASCGERIRGKNAVPLFMHESDISTRYRITSLVGRRPYVSLFFAIDNLQQRPVALREITIKGLSDEACQTACEAVQQEYDLLRREHIESIMPVIDLRHYQGHLYIVAGWPASAGEKALIMQLQTLQDVLQSGIGLPEIHLALAWMKQLCSSLDRLHQHSIVLGDLDPQVLVMNGSDYNGELALMVSWLPAAIRLLRPPALAISNMTNYSAPEVLLGKPEPASDVYSIGAILYLLLTGVPPDGPTTRMQHRLRTPGEINPRIKSGLDECVMKAIALGAAERYSSAWEMAEALCRLRSHTCRGEAKTRYTHSHHTPAPAQEQKGEESGNINTILITPLAATDLAAWHKGQAPEPTPLAPQADTPGSSEEEEQKQPQSPAPAHLDAAAHAEDDINANQKPSLAETFKKRITGILPAMPRTQLPKTPSRELGKPTTATTAALVPAAVAETARPGQDTSFLKQLQQLIRGKQRHVSTAAAIIETPLRVQPNQSYIIRIQIMGRDRAGRQQLEGKPGMASNGLSALAEGELVCIEVRSALYQNYTYIVQQVVVYIPAGGYAAEVTIPMQPLSSGPSGRRDRLHIFFMDELRQPLYEKPFVVELFVSHLVQAGREGHNVLPIPL